jgi:hypothetical protein
VKLSIRRLATQLVETQYHTVAFDNDDASSRI